MKSYWIKGMHKIMLKVKMFLYLFKCPKFIDAKITYAVKKCTSVAITPKKPYFASWRI